jgi:DNA-binding NtrC family response regulator
MATAKLRLEVHAGPDKGRTLDLESGSYVLGKAPGCSLILSDGQVSRRHLEVLVLHEGVQFRDLGSTNGSYAQGTRFETLVVSSGAKVSIGKTEISLTGQPPAARASSMAWFGPVYGESAAMRRLFDVLARVAPVDVPVLVHGETGTGKSLVAQAIHQASRRAAGPFVVLDPASASRSAVEQSFAEAEGGALLIDELGDLSLDAQARLLAALEGPGRNVRVIATTRRDLGGEVRTGRFPEPLLRRLAVVPVEVPPLRLRREDVTVIVQQFVSRAADLLRRRPPEIPAGALSTLQAYDWPGNLRELEQVLERACALSPGPVLDLRLLGLTADGPANTAPVAGSFGEARGRLIDAWERAYLTTLLQRYGGNVADASLAAGMDRAYLYRIVRKHALWSGE